jgi:hypothetical protein
MMLPVLSAPFSPFESWLATPSSGTGLKKLLRKPPGEPEDVAEELAQVAEELAGDVAEEVPEEVPGDVAELPDVGVGWRSPRVVFWISKLLAVCPRVVLRIFDLMYRW